MSQQHARNRITWLAIGVMAGMCVSYFWPHEPAYAISNDRDEDFALFTSPVSFGQTAQGIFVMDFVTGQLKGAVMNNKLGKFTNFYQRNIAEDFDVDPDDGEARYAIVAGAANLPSQGRNTTATGVIYVAELNSGQCIGYAFQYRESTQIVPEFELAIADRFRWRDAAN